MLIEQCSFPAPWSAKAFLSELENKFARYFVLLEVGRVIGYAGMWLFAGEAHITTIAVHPNYRNQGYGRLLMNFLIDFSQDHGVDTMILEVRVSNIPAIKLYSSLGFKKIGIRKNYYLEIHEDAIVMLRKFNEQNDMGEGEKMQIRGVVDRIEGDKIIVLLTDEGIVVQWPREFLPDVNESDILCFDVKMEVPAKEVRKMSPKSLLERLAMAS